MKAWIREKARRITDGYTCPFLGEKTSEEQHAHFISFAVPMSKAEQYDSYEELLAALLEKQPTTRHSQQ